MPAGPDTPPVLRWHAGRLEPAGALTAGVLAADSWRVEDGRALALRTHRARFLDAVPTGMRADAERFWAAAIAAIPRRGAWFPRVDLLRAEDAAERLQLRLRPAPPRERAVVLATHRGADPRRAPRVKGPDLEALLAVRRAAAEAGAGEGVLLGPEGVVVEGAYSALVWWRGDRLHAVPADLPRIRSVTEDVLLGLAARRGVPVARERVVPERLDGAELWVLSALHGPRLAIGWVDGPRLERLPGRLDAWLELLAAEREPLG